MLTVPLPVKAARSSAEVRVTVPDLSACTSGNVKPEVPA